MRSVGDYTLLHVLGEGGMGIVHLARHEPSGQRVALKVLRPQIVGDEEGRRRLAREVGSLQRVRSRWVAEILDADPWGPVPYVVMRYVPGRSLHDEVVEEGPIRGRDLDWFARCLIDAVAAVHAGGVLHRDIKPSNVIMEGRTPVLIDFGLARVADDPRITHTGWLLGTPGYLPPEILRGEDARPATDVHSWAATVAFAATGRPPFGRGPSAAIMDRARRGDHDLAGIEPRVRAVLDAALAPDAAGRPTVAQLQAWFRDPTISIFDTLGTVDPAAAGGGVGFAGPTTRPASAATAPRPVAETAPLAVGAAPTRQEWDDRSLPAAEPTLVEAAQESGVARLRRTCLWAALALLSGAGLATAPVPTAVIMLALVVVLRGLSLAGSVHGERRELRGARWHDGPRLVIGTPWHLVRSVPSTVVLVLWAAGLALAAGLLCYAVAAPGGVTLYVCGVVLATMLACGPGGSRVRGPVRRVLGPLSRSTRRWAAAMLVLAAVAVYLIVRFHAGGTDWTPWHDSPLGSAF
ncbi:serine/threonine-protein kinase [Nocardioides sp. BP30]|uniref:serine/threonine-protein kinase n=1 Tax=Nocardioides sp. BP30 TaxID=3036374 RepID=UPI0024694C4C|nr:serine/threonine-protein kinase [Nocardioides sp. BP30]WGL53630.1 serine/threonine-protein kinase [Nocardioides sp. BP30]